MAKLKGGLQFTGTLGELTAYKRSDSDTIILRRKGGPGKEQIKKDKSFDLVRRNNSEFSGRAKATWWLRQMTRPLHHSGDTLFTSRLSKLVTVVQKKDTVSKLGERGILFSQVPKLFEGFNLNRHHSLDSIIRNPIYYNLSKDTLSAKLNLPALIPGVNFFSPFHLPFFRITVVMGLLPDLGYDSNGYRPMGFTEPHPLTTTAQTAWYPVAKGMDAEEMILQLPVNKAPAIFTLVVSAGIGFGTVKDTDNRVEQAKYSGAAKIVCME